MVSFSKMLAVAVPVVALAQQCENKSGFVDEEGYSCEDWEGWVCEDAIETWSYTDQGQADLLENCCETCKDNKWTCTDNDDFEDEEGYNCDDWQGYDCYRALSKWEYSVRGLIGLLENCKRTCESCAYKMTGDCVDDLEFIDEKGYCCGHWQEYNCGKAHSLWGYSQEGEHDIRTKCQFSCETCGYDDCQDDQQFEDEEGYRCGEWKGYDCNDAVDEYEYSEQGQEDLLKACPHTCKTCDAKGGDDEKERPINTDAPTELFTFEQYSKVCKQQTEEEMCTDMGCKFKNKRGKVSCFQKKAKAVKCKKVKDFKTCLAIGCNVNDKLKCGGKPNFQ